MDDILQAKVTVVHQTTSKLINGQLEKQLRLPKYTSACENDVANNI